MSNPGDVVKRYIQPGTRVGGRYRVEDFIGAGAYGAIFSAIDGETMERVAVKAIAPPSDGKSETAVGRFKREMKVISRLRHPNIISIYDYGQTPEGLVYMVLEFINGQTLYDLVTSTKLSDEDAISIARQMTAGLAEAHDKGIVHRDLKPQNVMVSRAANGYAVKVLDFGMAKVLSAGDDSAAMQLTREGVAVGTPRYIAPEQARGKAVGPYSDIYALGLLIYEIFTGERAVKADTIESAIMAHVSPAPLELEEIDRVPAFIQPILFKMIAKKVNERYQNAAEILRDLDRADAERHRRESAATVPVGSRLAPEVPTPEPPRPLAPNPAPPSPQDRPRSFQSADDLQLDLDKMTRKPGYVPPVPAKQRRTIRGLSAVRDAEGFYVRTPHNVFEWMETFAVVMLAGPAFTLFTAQFEGMDYFPRLGLGLGPFLAAMATAVYLKSSDWMFSVVRMVMGVTLLLLVAAHVLGMDDLAVGLLRNPAWVLRPVQDVPLLSTLHDLMADFSRTYAGLISDHGPRG